MLLTRMPELLYLDLTMAGRVAVRSKNSVRRFELQVALLMIESPHFRCGIEYLIRK